jgi:hypothetical protein
MVVENRWPRYWKSRLTSTVSSYIIWARNKSTPNEAPDIIECLFFLLFTTRFNNLHPTLSQIAPLVATTSSRIWLILWNQPKIPVPLYQLFESYVSISFA